MKPYGLCADVHLHEWSQFATTLSDGVNSRLDGLLKELNRCAVETRNAGGDHMIVAGDLFHVRGSVSPQVLNPALDTFKEIIEAGIRVTIIPGNHDLAGKNTTRLGSAVTALAEVGCRVCNEPTLIPDEEGRGGVLVVPWVDAVKELKEKIVALTAGYDMDELKHIDLILHAPVNGVIEGLPDHGLDPDWLAALGFRRVFSGHYHNSKGFGGGVYSIGALAHHTFSDINSKAGFLIVGDGVRWMSSHLPEFQDLDRLVELDAESIPLLVDGNYVRVKTELSKPSEIDGIKSELTGYGAKGVIVNVVRKPEAVRTGSVTSSVSAGASLAVSIAEFVKGQSFTHTEQTSRECQAVLAEAGI